MDADSKTRRQVSCEQMSGLLEFLQEHPDLAKGLSRGRRGKIHSVKLWNLCAKKLNDIKEGATKDGKGWSKYWCDWKYRVRRKALELKVAKDSNKPPPEGVVPLSTMEDIIISLIGENAVDGVVIKSDPLADENDVDEELDDNNDDDDSEHQYSVTRSCNRRKRRRPLSMDVSVADEGGPSVTAERKPCFTANNNPDNTECDRGPLEFQFMRLGELQLEQTRKMTEALNCIATQVERVADAVARINERSYN